MISDGTAKSTNFRNPILIVALLALIHVVLAGWFAVVTPYRQSGALLNQRSPTGGPAIVQDIGAPDERQHANYIRHLLTGQGFPVFNPKDPDLYESYQSHQPPLYYVIATGWAKVLGVSAVESRDDGLKLRFLNVLLGALTIFGVYALGRAAFADESVALLGAAVAALLPTQSALDGAISNDPLLICLCTWSLALGARAMQNGWNWSLALRIALLVGLAIGTKTTGVALLLMLPIMIWLPKTGRPTVPMIGAMAATVAVIVLPWWFRNLSLYGDPLAIGAFNQAFTGSPQASGFISELGAPTYWFQWVGWWTLRSLVGVFGYMDIWLTNSGTQSGAAGIYLVVIGTMAVGLLSAVIRIPTQDDADRQANLLLAAFGIVVTVLFLRFNAQYFQAQARYLMPALGPLAVLLAYGATRVSKTRPAAFPAFLVLILAMTSVYALVRLPSEFQRRIDMGTVWH